MSGRDKMSANLGETVMDWTQTLSIMATCVATAYYIHREIQADIKIQSARTDRLYEMFIELLKERKN